MKWYIVLAAVVGHIRATDSGRSVKWEVYQAITHRKLRISLYTKFNSQVVGVIISREAKESITQGFTTVDSIGQHKAAFYPILI